MGMTYTKASDGALNNYKQRPQKNGHTDNQRENKCPDWELGVPDLDGDNSKDKHGH